MCLCDPQERGTGDTRGNGLLFGLFVLYRCDRMQRESPVRLHPVLLFLGACAAMTPTVAMAQAAPAQKPKAAAAQAGIVYRNNVYDFCFVLPGSWKGYAILTDEWTAEGPDSSRQVGGPIITIRHPKWTTANPYQDIPIWVFTPEVWKLVDSGEISVSAAPIGPAELGSNGKYVFALPPRWIGFTDTLGQDELDTWMQQNRLQAPCGHKPAKLTGNIP